MNPSVKKIIPVQVLRDLKIKPLPQFHDYHLQLLLISHHYVLVCLDYLPLPSLRLQQSQELSYISVTFCGPLLYLQVSACPCHWIAAVLYLLGAKYMLIL